jgi:probable rRNA maturation factor
MLEMIGNINYIESDTIKAEVDQFYKIYGISKDSIVELKFSTSDEMRELNNKYLKNNKTTDVLSFPQSSYPSQKSILGTICICKDELKIGKKHIIELVLHGLFHLIGYDHDLNPKKWEQAVKKYETIY